MGNEKSQPQPIVPTDEEIQKDKEEKLQQDIDVAFKDLIESMDKMDKHLENMVESYKAENDEAEKNNKHPIQNS